MKKSTILSLIFLVLFLKMANSYSNANPTWISNPYFCAGNNNIINSNTIGGQTRSQNIPFTVAFTGVPTIVYGIKTYKGTDQIWQTNFAIRKTSIAQNNWRAQISLYGSSNMWMFGIQYLAVDPSFPYHLNIFDDFPFEYSSTLTNITTSSSVLTSFTQVIDYSQQASTKTFKAFTLPLTDNKLVVYISSLTMTANTSAPIKLDLSYTIINETFYSWTAKLFQYGTVTNLRLCEIVYNEANIKSSNQFVAIKYDWITNGASDSLVFQSNFEKSMICGMTFFGTYSGSCALDYDWDFVNDLGGSLESIRLRASVPSGNSTATCGDNFFETTLFYIKTWNCPGTNVYFNLTTDLCQNACAEYYYFNFAAATCTPCHYSCYNCTAAYLSDRCSNCESGLKRYLVNNTCLCSTGYFDDGFEPGCLACISVDPNSLSCTYAIDPLQPTSYYQNIYNQTTWATDILPNFTSLTCVTAYFVNSSSLCQPCPSYCIDCTDSLTCTTCNSSSPAILYSNNFCYLCDIANCLSCYPDNVCVSCQSPLVVSEGVCMTCVAACVCNGWVLPKVNGSCSTLCGDGIKVGAQECDDGNINDHDGCSATCTVEPCNLNCSCDGWVSPWVTSNSSCTTVCGDSLKRGLQQCDDGNLIDHDGCSSICTIQPCHISCLCDGWYPPWNALINSCLTQCGDGYARGTEKCDDGNLLNGDGCDSQCHIEIPPLMTAKMSEYPSLILFLMGFRIVGLQALNVYQSFQLICDSTNNYLFKISFNIHGYNNSNAFPISIPETFPQEGQFLTKFNFMYMVVLAFFIVGLILESYLLCCCVDNRVTDSSAVIDKQNRLKQGSYDENHSDLSGDFTVHYKGENHIKIQETHPEHLDSQHLQSSASFQQRIFMKAITITRQVFFHLMVNLLCILVYSITDQIKTLSMSSFANPQTLIVIITMVIFIGLIGMIFVLRTFTFGQNLLKFNKGQAFEYWLLMIGEKIIFSAILGSKSFWNLQIILILKFFLLTYYCCTRLYFEDLQKIRSVVTHFIHFLLIFAVIINQHIFKMHGLLETFPILFMQSIYLALLCLVLLIQIIFYIREITQECEADIRQIDDSERVQAANNGLIKAVFAVKNFQNMEDSAQNFNLAGSNILEEIKKKKAQRISAFSDLPTDLENFDTILTSKSSDLNPSHLALGSMKKNLSHVRSQRGSNMMSVLQIQEQRQSQIQQISVEQSSHKRKESNGSLQNGFTNEEIKVNFDQPEMKKESPKTEPHVLQIPKGFKNYAHHLAFANKRKMAEDKMFKTDEQPDQEDTETNSDQFGRGFDTDNVIAEGRKQQRVMTFHQSQKNSVADNLQHSDHQKTKDDVQFHQIKIDHKPTQEQANETVSINLEQPK